MRLKSDIVIKRSINTVFDFFIKDFIANYSRLYQLTDKRNNKRTGTVLPSELSVEIHQMDEQKIQVGSRFQVLKTKIPSMPRYARYLRNQKRLQVYNPENYKVQTEKEIYEVSELVINEAITFLIYKTELIGFIKYSFNRRSQFTTTVICDLTFNKNDFLQSLWIFILLRVFKSSIKNSIAIHLECLKELIELF